MPKFKIITRKDCPNCKKLKSWLKKNKVNYQEIDYLDSALNEIIQKDESFVTQYCDTSQCVEDTPIIIKNDKEYFYAEIWDFETGKLLEDKAKKIFEIS
jgi:glutaredoxin